MEIRIKTFEDEHECETCGTSYAVGGSVYVDGRHVLTREPLAFCYDSVDFSYEELLILALSELGIDVLVDNDNAADKINERYKNSENTYDD